MHQTSSDSSDLPSQRQVDHSASPSRSLDAEGKKDREAFLALGFDNVYTITGIGPSCEKIRQADRTRAVILTDRDRAGVVKCRQVAGKLQSCGIAADAETRRQLSSLLVLRNFQDIAYRLNTEKKRNKNGEKYGKDIH